MSKADYAARLCTTRADYEAALELRMQVFHHEQGYEADIEIDEKDPISAHFILCHKDDPATAVGVIRLVPYPYPDVAEAAERFPDGTISTATELAAAFRLAARTHPEKGGAKIGRVAVRKEARGKQLGSLLLAEAERWIREALVADVVPLKAATLCLSSQVIAKVRGVWSTRRE